LTPLLAGGCVVYFAVAVVIPFVADFFGGGDVPNAVGPFVLVAELDAIATGSDASGPVCA
jgi:hypothetical protein